jgi:hypothetical protein
MKKIILFIITIVFYLLWNITLYADFWSDLKNDFLGSLDSKTSIKWDMLVWETNTSLIPWNNENKKVDLDIWWWDGIEILDILQSIQKYILWLVWIITIWVLIYIWFLLISWEWNPDEIKKAFKAFIYLVVWLAIIPLSYVAVKIVTWLNF